jgi:hypothetical protein
MKKIPSIGQGDGAVRTEQNGETLEQKDKKPVLRDNREILVRDLHSFSGKEIMDRILEYDNPQEIVQDLPYEDFFWLVKKVGEDDCLPLLELGSVDQWQYLLDLEIWEKDRLDVTHISRWIKQLQQADSKRLVRWLFSEGELLAYYHFFKSIEVIIKAEDEVFEIPAGFFSLDGIFYIGVTDSEHREFIEHIIRVMANEDFDRYQALILGLAGVLPAELEEEMYRSRNVRLAEHGFLPFEEAVSIYAPLDPETLTIEKRPELPHVLSDEDIRDIIPISPLYHAGAKTMLTEATSRITDPLFLDKIRLEFAGLCNQVLSADNLLVNEFDVLIRTCRKASGYVNLALERACGRDISMAQQLLKSQPLGSLFRVGFGLALKLKWEAERWLEGSWFYRLELGTEFWGENWGGMLAGLVAKRPRRYVGLQGGEEYGDFEWLSELGECLQVLRRVMVLDSLLERLAARYQIDEGVIQSSELSFRQLLFSFWARLLLDIEPSFSRISLKQTRSFFQLLRAGKSKPPYRMPGFEEKFVNDFMAYAADSDPEAASILENTLSLIWQEFREEYERVSLSDLDGRYSKFV